MPLWKRPGKYEEAGQVRDGGDGIELYQKDGTEIAGVKDLPDFAVHVSCAIACEHAVWLVERDRG